MSILVGIAGGTGAGKSTLAHRVQESLPGQVGVMQQDWYYRDQRHLSFDERLATNYDHPDAIETPLLLEHLERLLAGNPVWTPRYDFGQHIRKKRSLRFEPWPVVVLEGLHALGDPEIRNKMTLTVFVELDADLRFIRRLRRDMTERGRSLESVFRQYLDQVRPMHAQWVAPTKAYADIIVSGADDQGSQRVVEAIHYHLAGYPDSQ